MLTESEWKTLKVALQLLSKTRTIPFDWDTNQGILVPTGSKLKVCLSFVSLFVSAAYFIFSAATFPATLQRPGENPADVVLHLICPLWYALLVVLSFIMNFQRRHEFAALFNQQISFSSEKGLKYMNSNFLPKRRREFFFRWSMPNLFQCIFIWIPLTVLMRDKYLFVFSALPEQWKTLHVLVVVTIGEFLFAVSYIMTVIIMFYIVCTYLMSSKFWLNQLCVKWPKEQLSSGASREVRHKNVETSFSVYRSMELLNKIYNGCFSSWIMPVLKVFTTFVATMTIYSVIKFRGRMHPLLEIMFGIVAVILLSFLVMVCIAGASFHDNTKRFRTNYGYVLMKFPLDAQKYYKRVLMSCQPFGFRVGSFYVIKKITIASVISLLLNAILFLLLTY